MDKFDENLDPNTLYFAKIIGYGTIYAPLKFTGNKAGCGLMNIDIDFKDKNHAKQILD